MLTPRYRGGTLANVKRLIGGIKTYGLQAHKLKGYYILLAQH